MFDFQYLNGCLFWNRQFKSQTDFRTTNLSINTFDFHGTLGHTNSFIELQRNTEINNLKLEVLFFVVVRFVIYLHNCCVIDNR